MDASGFDTGAAERAAKANMSFAEIIKVRRSLRKYVAAEITEGEIADIVEDALQAPSWKNGEPTHYRVALTKEARERAVLALAQFNRERAEDASALVAVTFEKSKSGFDDGGKPVNEAGELWGAYDAGIATAYFILAARNRGWDTLIMGIRDEAAVRKNFAVPDGEIVLAVLALGKGAVVPKEPQHAAVAEKLAIL
ncbi:MAG: nitroreductase family protein [Kiritimatiellae bacterium]|nr:nitroreductase family protein [Kiritimatiellia bacterium]